MIKTRFKAWPLFWVLSLALSSAVVVVMPFTDLRSVDGIVFMTAHAVRCSLVPFLLTFAASPLATLWRSETTRYLLANRRYLGLVFAVGMGWQLVFIGWIAIHDFPYFVRTFVNLPNLIAGVIPYLFLIAMTLTSFRRYARHLSTRNWRVLHKSGIYILWLTILSTNFLYVLYGVKGPNTFRSLFAALFLSAWVLRIAAWAQKRRVRCRQAAQFLETVRNPATTLD